MRPGFQLELKKNALGSQDAITRPRSGLGAVPSSISNLLLQDNPSVALPLDPSEIFFNLFMENFSHFLNEVSQNWNKLTLFVVKSSQKKVQGSRNNVNTTF